MHVNNYCSQLRLHARYSGREVPFALHDGFEAAAVATGQLYHRFVSISNHGVKNFFAASLVLPLVGLILLLIFTKGAGFHVRKYMNDPHNFPTLAAVFWIGQTFTLLVIAFDSRAIHEELTTHTMKSTEVQTLGVMAAVYTLHMR